MNNSRSLFIEILHNLSPEKMTSLSERKLENSGLRKRIFDDCPSFLTLTDVQNLSSMFENIVSMLKPSKTEYGYQLTNPTDQNLIRNLEKIIIEIAHKDLLNKNGSIKSEILQILNWNKKLTNDVIIDVICAYVSTVNQDIIFHLNQNSKSFSEMNNNSLNAVFDFINANYNSWIKEELKKAYFSTIQEHSRNNHRLFSPSVTTNNRTSITDVIGIPICGVVDFSKCKFG
jgi:hypothetical protein